MNVTPCKKYWIPILRIIVQHGGSASIGIIYEHLAGDMQNTLRPGDLLKNGNNPVWKYNVRNARESMVQAGFLLRSGKDSPRAVWVITEEGRAMLEEHEQKIEKMRSARNRFDMLRSHVLTETKAIAEPLEGMSFDYSDLNRNIGNIDYFLEQVSCDIDFEMEKLEI